MFKPIQISFLAIFLAGGGQAAASEEILSNSFLSDTPAVAAKVYVHPYVIDNNRRIAALEMAITTLQMNLFAANKTIATLQSNLDAVQANSVLALDGYLGFVMDASGYATVRFSGVNVQVVNGAAQAKPNGVGNLIVGYNNARTGTVLVCSDGQYTDQSNCEMNGEIWANSHKSGSHNLVVGEFNSYSQYGGLVVGIGNVINRSYASVSGGYGNIASGYGSSVSGGVGNKASGRATSVSSGASNIAKGGASSVSGGLGNTVSGMGSSISAGDESVASGYVSSVSGGGGHISSGYGSSISGGRYSVASGDSSSVSGGGGHSANGDGSSVSGGFGNTAGGEASSVSGGNIRAVSGEYDWSAGALFEDN
ncbi:MAG: hypothetical protein L3J88_11825 [Gammaproteobacteria bacterium]|nr:hypothetical protein [Gammaproteobacteria bacterium]